MAAQTQEGTWNRRMEAADWAVWFGNVDAFGYAVGCEIPLEERVADDLHSAHPELDQDEIDVLAPRLAAYALRQVFDGLDDFSF